MCAQKLEEDIGFSGARVKGHCEPLGVGLGTELPSLEEKQTFLAAVLLHREGPPSCLLLSAGKLSSLFWSLHLDLCILYTVPRLELSALPNPEVPRVTLQA